MGYTIYGDILFLENAAVQFLVLSIASGILQTKPSIKRNLISASIGAMLNVAGCMLLYSYPAAIQLVFYGVTCYLMTLFCFRRTRALPAVFLADFLVTGLLSTLFTGPAAFTGYLISFAGIYLLCRILLGKRNEFLRKEKRCYQVELHINGNVERFSAFLDTGNMLRLPWSGKGIIVADAFVMRKLLPPELQKFTDTYVSTGVIDYSAFSAAKTRLRLLPVFYGCINHKPGTMPAILCDRVILDHHEMEFTDIPVCFTQNSFGSSYHMLLPESLCQE
jgi:sigma-E processing peptidase SpoIIGA